MVIKSACYILNTDADFQAIIGQNKSMTKYKAYAGICPQPEEYPYSVVRLTAKPPLQCKGTRSSTFNGSFSVHCFHRNYDDVVALCNAVVDALDSKNGTFNGYKFQRISYVDQLDGEYQVQYKIHQRIVVFEFTSNEDTPT